MLQILRRASYGVTCGVTVVIRYEVPPGRNLVLGFLEIGQPTLREWVGENLHVENS